MDNSNEILNRAGLTLTPPVTGGADTGDTDVATNPPTKKLNGWQVYVGEKLDIHLDEGMTFGDASKFLKSQWRALSSEERSAYNEEGRNGVVMDVSCSVCDKVFASSGRKNLHMKECGRKMEVKVPCPVCLKMFANERSMKEHQNALHTVQFRCSMCLKCFGGKAKLKRHLSVHDKSKCRISWGTYDFEKKKWGTFYIWGDLENSF